MSRHTNEPCATEYRERPDGMFAQEIFDADGETIATMAWYPVKEGVGTTTNRKDNAMRLVACVNACAGIPDEWLAEGPQRVWRELTARSDELLSALKRIEEYPETSQQELGVAAIKYIARVAIEKAEGDDK